jgi:DNA-directed RNA polymerase specialized sigma24 family protein
MTFIDRTRKKQFTVTDELPEVTDPSPAPTERLIARERRTEILAAINALRGIWQGLA